MSNDMSFGKLDNLNDPISAILDVYSQYLNACTQDGGAYQKYSAEIFRIQKQAAAFMEVILERHGWESPYSLGPYSGNDVIDSGTLDKYLENMEIHFRALHTEKDIDDFKSKIHMQFDSMK